MNYIPETGLGYIQTSASDSFISIVTTPRMDRWLIYARLQELMIPCWCLDDGSLRVEVNTCTAALLLRSVLQQFIASRQEILNWLTYCWQID
jgi:hypothetical protein